MASAPRYRIVVAHDELRFSSAHFIAFPGFREPLHGHNYQLTVTIDAALGADGFVLDFCLVKRLAEALCHELADRTLLPARSDALRVELRPEVVEILAEDGARFVLPRADVVLLPVVHTSAEEIAAYCLGRLRAALAAELAGRPILSIEVSVAEAPGQAAFCREDW